MLRQRDSIKDIIINWIIMILIILPVASIGLVYGFASVLWVLGAI
tara:strand:+ start:83 stop:217 length:135 start_codon:yes stop_codon:yes gene_type:complete